MDQKTRKWLKFVLRWGIAIAGIWYVLANLTLRDRAMVLLGPDNLPISVALAPGASEDSATFPVLDPHSGELIPLPRERVVNPPDQKKITLIGQTEPVALLGLDLVGDLNKQPRVNRLLVRSPDGHAGQWITPDQVQGGKYVVRIPRPRLDIGLIRMVNNASPSMLLAAIMAILPIYLIVAYRWNELLKALDIHIGQARTFSLTMVGSFYNSFMPGSTGGDLLKAYYVAKQTTHRTRAVMSVIIDRAIGLLALIIMGGTMAAFQWEMRDCRYVAITSAVIVFSLIVGLVIFFNPVLRKFTGLDFVLSKLPMQKQVKKAVETVQILGRHPLLVLWVLIVTFPVHMLVVVSATFAGRAFGLPIGMGYYWVVVPVVVLVGAIPISPQGAGVMEFFAFHLMNKQGATIGQAVALTMSIRIVQLVWNLLAGIFVLRGGYHTPTKVEQSELEDGPGETV